MHLHPGEPEAAPWRPLNDEDLVRLLGSLLPERRGVLLVDGRSGSGKSTSSARAADLLDGADR
jgi:Tfp pilus assembly pilus retraction ATPase PilT